MAVDVTYTAPSGGTVYAGRVAPGGVPSALLVGALDSITGNLSSAIAPAPADWAARSTAAGVVWAHRFDWATEVSQHLAGTSDPKGYGVAPRRVVDENGEGCLEQVMLGAALTAPFTAGGTSMQIDDATMWPNPATEGNFYFIAHTAVPNVGSKNLFFCTARTGTTLTVAYVDNSGNSAFAATPQSYPVGAYVGHEAQLEWRRVFSALPATENGLPVDDRADGGAVPLRSRWTGNALSVPRDVSLWQYGWYGHPSNQATWANWTPWQGASALTPRGVSQGAGPRFGLWDGDEFWVQFRVKIDPRFFQFHAQPDPNSDTSFWGRKMWAIQSELASTNQIVTGMMPSNRFNLPATNPSPLSLSTYKASRILGVSDWARPSGQSHQKGSPWDVAPHFADLTTSFLPSSGLSTPDGAAAWEQPTGEWVTFLLRVRPGRSNVAESLVELKFARQDAPGYNGQYTTLFSANDVRIVYSGSGDYDYPDGAFSYPGVTTMDALPGFQAFGLMGYLNVSQSAALPVARRSYYVRMGQVIFSRQAIAAPAPPVPAWVPAPGNLTTLTVANGGLSNQWRDVLDAYYEPFDAVKSVNDYSGAFPDPWWGTYGAIVFFGGGHAATNHNGVTVAELTATGITYKRATNATPWFGTGTDSTTRGNNSGSTLTNPLTNLDYMESTIDGKPGSPHSYGSGDVIGPDFGGAAHGTFLRVVTAAVNRVNDAGTVAAHQLPFTSAVGNGGAGNWSRVTNTFIAPGATWQAPQLTAFVGPQQRVYIQTNNSAPNVRWFDRVTSSWVTGTGTTFDYDNGADGFDSGAMFYVPARGLLLCLYPASNSLRLQWMDVSVAQPTLGGTATLSSAIAVSNPWSAACWCPDSNRIIVGKAGQSGVFEIAIPAVLTDAWPVVYAAFGNGGTIPFETSGEGGNTWKKWSYQPRVKAIVYQRFASHDAADVVHVYRPRNT